MVAALFTVELAYSVVWEENPKQRCLDHYEKEVGQNEIDYQIKAEEVKHGRVWELQGDHHRGEQRRIDGRKDEVDQER